MDRAAIGDAPKRREDVRFLTGRGAYLDDLAVDGVAHAVVLRSPHAHARIAGLDACMARAAPGVVAVLTSAEIAADGLKALRPTVEANVQTGEPFAFAPQTLLATDTVRFVGEPVALIVAETPAEALDAADLVAVEYVPLPAVTTAAAARAPGAPQLSPEVPGNVCLDWRMGDGTGVERAFAAAAHLVELTLDNHRIVINPMEPRGGIGQYDRATGRYTLHVSSQNIHGIRDAVARALGVAPTAVRLVAPDVGGGFGAKNFVYAEHVLLPWAAKRVGRPVKWIASRSEVFLSDHQARDHHAQATLALDAGGRFIALRVTSTANIGAYMAGGSGAAGAHSEHQNWPVFARAVRRRGHETSGDGPPLWGAKADKRARRGESVMMSLQHHREPHNRAPLTRRDLLGAAVGSMIAGMPPLARAAAPHGQLTWGVIISLAPTWFDPAETSGIITPYMVLYALHDAMVKPMPGQPLAPCLAESWTASEDALTYEFVLRDGARFHNGDEVTAEDVKFSFERYRGTSHQTLKERVGSVETPDPRRVRLRLKEPWPDFLTFYVEATGAGWIVPKKYVERVGEESFKKAPVGAGPYKFVSFTPGLELTLEAFDQYWRKTPNVKRLVFKAIPDEATRLVALKRGEVDIAYTIRGELAQEVLRTKGLTLKPIIGKTTFWLYFADQWNPRSPWHDERVRRAADLAIDRETINQALTLGKSQLTGSIIPNIFEYYWQPAVPTYDPAKARRLLAEAGYPRGFDAGEYNCDGSFADLAEAVLNNLQQVGIRTKLRPLERAAFFKGYAEKSLKNVIQGASGAFGNTATRLEAFVAKGGAYVYGSYPDIDALFQEQASELNGARREAMLHKIQQLVHERAIYAPIWQQASIQATGPRVGESGLGLIAGHVYSSPYEDVTLAGK